MWTNGEIQAKSHVIQGFCINWIGLLPCRWGQSGSQQNKSKWQTNYGVNNSQILTLPCSVTSESWHLLCLPRIWWLIVWKEGDKNLWIIRFFRSQNTGIVIEVIHCLNDMLLIILVCLCSKKKGIFILNRFFMIRENSFVVLTKGLGLSVMSFVDFADKWGDRGAGVYIWRFNLQK